MFMSEAPSASPVIASVGAGSVDAGVSRLPFESKVSVPGHRRHGRRRCRQPGMRSE